jgi:hypothetical protein
MMVSLFGVSVAEMSVSLKETRPILSPFEIRGWTFRRALPTPCEGYGNVSFCQVEEPNAP